MITRTRATTMQDSFVQEVDDQLRGNTKGKQISYAVFGMLCNVIAIGLFVITTVALYRVSPKPIVTFGLLVMAIIAILDSLSKFLKALGNFIIGIRR